MATKITDSLRNSIAAEKQKNNTDIKKGPQTVKKPAVLSAKPKQKPVKKPNTKKTATNKIPAASKITSKVVQNKSLQSSIAAEKPKDTVKKPTKKLIPKVVAKPSKAPVKAKKKVIKKVSQPKKQTAKKAVDSSSQPYTTANSTKALMNNKLHQIVENHHNVCKTYIENLLMANDSLHEYLDQLVEIKNISSLIRLNLSYLTSAPTRYQKMLAQNKNIFSDFFKFTLTRD